MSLFSWLSESNFRQFRKLPKIAERFKVESGFKKNYPTYRPGKYNVNQRSGKDVPSEEAADIHNWQVGYSTTEQLLVVQKWHWREKAIIKPICNLPQIMWGTQQANERRCSGEIELKLIFDCMKSTMCGGKLMLHSTLNRPLPRWRHHHAVGLFLSSRDRKKVQSWWKWVEIQGSIIKKGRLRWVVNF